MQFTKEDNAGADIIIQSSDGHKFYVHKTNLSAGSQTFADMLSSAATLDDASLSTVDELPFVVLTEKGVDILAMLPYFYLELDRQGLLHNKNNVDVERAYRGFQISEKYQMHHWVRELLLLLLEKNGSQLVNTEEWIQDHRGFMRLFEPGCPDSLSELKAKILPEIANYIVAREDINCLASFAEMDQVQMKDYYSRGFILKYLKLMPEYDQIESCQERGCSQEELMTLLYRALIKATPPQRSDLRVSKATREAMCGDCLSNFSKLIQQLQPALLLGGQFC